MPNTTIFNPKTSNSGLVLADTAIRCTSFASLFLQQRRLKGACFTAQTISLFKRISTIATFPVRFAPGPLLLQILVLNRCLPDNTVLAYLTDLKSIHAFIATSAFPLFNVMLALTVHAPHLSERIIGIGDKPRCCGQLHWTFLAADAPALTSVGKSINALEIHIEAFPGHGM